MSLDEIRQQLFANEAVQEKLLSLISDSVCTQFPQTFVRKAFTNEAPHEWPYLLMLGSLFAGSEAGDHQDVALRIAQYCLQANDTNDEEKCAAGAILESLSNAPALALATSRELLDEGFQRSLPLFSRMQNVHSRLATTVHLRDKSPLRLNRFQHAFWDNLREARWLSVSAPTSAGKSFVVTRWLIDSIPHGQQRVCVYLVPTRALVQQVERDLKEYAQDTKRPVHISSVPRRASLKPGISHVFIFTQERLHVFLTSGQAELSIGIDTLIVDEAQKIGDRHRGVLLQLVIEQVIAINPRMRLVFISPMTDNPEELHASAPTSVPTRTLRAEEITVNQNLLWASQLPRTSKEWSVSLCLSDKLIELGRITLADKPNPDSKRLPFVAHALGRGRPGNILYANTAATAETMAQQLYDLLGKEADISQDPDIRNLDDLIEQVVHPEYLLRRVLARGIAFHYGNMPLLVRTEIERLFGLGKVTYLVCTSTLVEGVNTACRMICVRGPKKGLGHRMTAEDFWNLAGRAGRLGREFQGNIVCVDAMKPDLWEGGAPPLSRKKYRIERTTDQILNNPADLISFIKDGTPRSIASKRPDLEYVASYLITSHIRYGSVEQAPWSKRFSSEGIKELAQIVEAAWSSLEIPESVVRRNPSISPLALQSLLKYFEDRTDVEKMPIETLLPADPGSSDAVDAYTKIFTRCAAHLVPALGPSGPRCFILALLVTRWMRGMPLARLIDDRVKYWTTGAGKEKKDRPSVSRIIRSVLEDVETIARFEAPRAVAAYSDVLRIFLQRRGRSDLAQQLEDASILLELGVSIPTQVSLMAVGLSRATAIRISELIASDSLTETEAIDWLSSYPIESLEMPELMKREIREVLRLHVSYDTSD